MSASLGKLRRIELGRRDYGGKVYCKVWFSEADEFELMMLKGDEQMNWRKHAPRKTVDIPGGVLFPCCPNCTCFLHTLYRVEDIDHEVNRIASEHNADPERARASMLLHAYRCKPREAVQKMDVDDPEQVIHMAQEFMRKTTSETEFEGITSDTVLELEKHQ